MNDKGFTLIELILVTIILGILAAVAVPRYMGTINRSEAAAEDEVLRILKLNAESFAMEQFMDTGRQSYPSNPFSGALVDGYVGDGNDVLKSGDWSYVPFPDGISGHIRHKRNDDSIWLWTYTSSDRFEAQADDRGEFFSREQAGRVNGDQSDL